MPTEWYYQSGGERCGPVSGGELKALAQSGQLLPTDLIWKEGKSDWRPASNVKGLFADSHRSQVEPPPLPTSPRAIPHDKLNKTPTAHDPAETTTSVWSRLRSWWSTIWNVVKHFWIRSAAWHLGTWRSTIHSAKSSHAENVTDSATLAENSTHSAIPAEPRLSFSDVFPAIPGRSASSRSLGFRGE